MREEIVLDYTKDKNEVASTYINILENSLDNEDFNIHTIEKKLDSYMDNELNDIDNIIYRLDNNKQVLYSKSNNMREVFNVAKVLARDMESYGKKLLDYNQIKSIRLYGIDEDKIVDLQDTIEDHKLKYNNELNKLRDKYRTFLDESNESFNNLDENEKTNVRMSIFRFLKSKNINVNPDEVLQENWLTDIIFGTIPCAIEFLFGVIKKFWVVLVVTLGLNYLTDNFIFRLLGNFSESILNGVTSLFFITVIVLGCCLAIKLYHIYYDYKYSKENEELSNRLDEANKKAKSSNSNKVVELNKNKENTFRGFNNTASYNPNGNNAKDPRYDVF